jgi:hypothetical protein
MSQEITEQEFLHFVYEYVMQYPEIAGEIGSRVRRALQDRLAAERKKSCDLETVALTLADRISLDSLRDRDRELVLEKMTALAGRTSFPWDDTLARLAEEKA